MWVLIPDVDGMATVLAPTLFRSPDGAFGDQKDSQLQIKVITPAVLLQQKTQTTQFCI